ncbi:MAG: ABC transporter ATP-binding protein [Alphaproteobacteria bacterium]|nr:ABC transporter ATP-binding protein [Alphaproteobacteria bacterium]
MREAALLRSQGLSASYGHVEVLKPIDIHVAPGEFIAILGPNGAGKTTLLKAIMRLIPSQGELMFDGQSIVNTPTWALADLGMTLVPESRMIFGPMTVLENLQLGAYSRPGADRAAVNADFEAVLKLFPKLSQRLDQIAGSLSGGEQQMLAVGRALMVHPRLLLLDEPSLGLAPRASSEVFQALGQLNQQGLTILVVEQKAPLALSLAHRAYVMHTGQIIATPDPKDIASRDALAHLYLGDIQ